MLAFLTIGIIGLAIVLLSLLLGDLLDGVFDAFDVEFAGGVFSTPVIGSFLAAFGFGAALTMYGAGVGATGGAFAGLASGIAIGGIALVMTRSLMHMPTDHTPAASDNVGAHGTVVTTIPEGGYGEVSLRAHGQVEKYNARGTAAIGAGQAVEVVEVLSASSVLVRPVEAEPPSTPPDRDAEPGPDADADSDDRRP